MKTVALESGGGTGDRRVYLGRRVSLECLSQLKLILPSGCTDDLEAKMGGTKMSFADGG